jgi:LCP family protein required for cell wall assembly
LFSILFLGMMLLVAAVLLLVSTVALQLRDGRPAKAYGGVDDRPALVGPPPGLGPAVEPTIDPDVAARMWDGHGPLNVLLLGIDQADCKYGADQPTQATRTDTMILVRLDPKTRQVAMLSVPRDLLVNIPGEGPGKINTAHMWGEVHDYKPDGGPGLLKETLWESLGLQVHRYVRVDLEGFRKLLEILDGLDMDLPPQPDNPTVALWDDEYPDGHCGTMTLNFKPGRQHLSPEQVIQYARSRHSTSDFDRSRRQQEVLVALRARLLQPDIIWLAPELLKQLIETVKTDFTAREITSLAPLAQGVNTAGIAHLQLDEGALYDVPKSAYGWVLRLKPVEAQEVLRRFQAFEPPPTATPVPTRDPNATRVPVRRRPTAAPTAEITGDGTAVDPNAPPGDGQAVATPETPPEAAPTEPPTEPPPPPPDPDEDE